MDYDAIPARVGSAVGAAMDRLSRSLTDAGAGLDLVAPLSAMATRGKRLRSTLLLLSHAAAGGGREESATRVAAALELFQVAALVHDDVLDDSDTRRGQPSTHRALERLHADAGWRGGSARFGTSGAILAGDLALMACMGELAAALAGVDAEVAVAVGDRFTAMATVCTAGQYLDLRLAAQPLESIADEREAIGTVMRTKTASYTTVGPLALGAALAGCAPATVDEWAKAGLPLGVAFQLRDDVLGVIGSQAQTGKPTGDDVREGKRTLLLAHALANTDDAGRRCLAEAVGGTPDTVAAAVEVLVASGAIAEAETQIELLAADARALIGAIDMDPIYRERLSALFESLTERVA